MAVKLDNIDSVIKGLSKLDKSVGLEVIRDARKRMRSTIRKYVPIYKKITKANTVTKTGDLVKSIKVKSRSKRGVSKVQLKFTVPYAGYLNFTKGYNTEGFASNEYDKDKDTLEAQGIEDVREAFKTTFNKYGIEFK